MTLKATRLLPNNKKAESTVFKPSLSAYGGIYDKEATLTKNVTIYQGVGTSKTTRVEGEGYHVQWQLLGVPQHTIVTTTTDSKAKEIITIPSEPKSKILELAIIANLDPENVNGDTVNWNKPDGTTWGVFDRLIITDSKDNVHYGKYLDPETGKNIRIELPDIPPENYPIEVDPTYQVSSFQTLTLQPYGFGLGVNNGIGTTLFLPGLATGFEIWYTTDTTDWSGGDETSSSNFAQSDIVKVGQALRLSTNQIILIGTKNSSGAWPVYCERIDTDRTYNGKVAVTGLSNAANGSPHAIRDANDHIYVLGPNGQFAMGFAVSTDGGDSFSALNAPAFQYNSANTRDKLQLLDLGLTILAAVRNWDNGSNGEIYESTYTKSTGLWSAPASIPPAASDSIEGQARIRLIQVSNGDIYLYYRTDAGTDGLLKKDVGTGTWSTVTPGGTDMNGEAFVTLAANDVIVFADSVATGKRKKYDTVGDSWSEDTITTTTAMVGGRNYSNLDDDGELLFYVASDGSGSYYIEDSLSSPGNGGAIGNQHSVFSNMMTQAPNDSIKSRMFS